MAQAVQCDICGKLFSSSYVKSHKRLAHGSSDSSGVGAVKKILALFKSLSAEDKKKVIEDLSAIARKAK